MSPYVCECLVESKKKKTYTNIYEMSFESYNLHYL